MKTTKRSETPRPTMNLRTGVRAGVNLSNNAGEELRRRATITDDVSASAIGALV